MEKLLNKWAEEIHNNAVAHGWHTGERSFGDIVALCHSELSEALEEYRAGRPLLWYACREVEMPVGICNPAEGFDCLAYGKEESCKWRGTKPEGIAVEMIDCIIRILDWCAKEGVDVDNLLQMKHEYNRTRPYRHGGKLL